MSITLTHIDEVLPHIEGRHEFAVADRGSYKVVDYRCTTHGTFDDRVRIECRGLKFDQDGWIIARPFHKFFNVGEVPETRVEAIDFGKPHVIMDKLDGSMVHPALISGVVVLMTRAGRTDVARLAERHLTTELIIACREWLEEGWTPIFEFTAPDNRIVINYSESRLTVLAVRDTMTGRYSTNEAINFGASSGLRLVKHHESLWRTGEEFRDYAKAVMGAEGFVVRFADGLMVKAKAEDYVLKHRAKDSVLKEKTVLALVLRDEIDDVLALLDDTDRARVERYRDQVEDGLIDTTFRVSGIVSSGAALSQKEFATAHLADVEPALRPTCFAVRAGANPWDVVRATALKGTGSITGVDSVRHLFGATFVPAPLNDNGLALEVAA
ncbi:MAG: RNA ligase [Xanthobacteraceae bacterium]